MVTMGILPYQWKNPHGRAGNRTRDLIISSQKRWPLDHEEFVLDCPRHFVTSLWPYTTFMTAAPAETVGQEGQCLHSLCANYDKQRLPIPTRHKTLIDVDHQSLQKRQNPHLWRAGTGRAISREIPTTNHRAKVILPYETVKLILIEGIPLCFNSRSTANCFKSTIKTQQYCIILLF
jgi:hypothetical protein